jgi:hypothetical protein
MTTQTILLERAPRLSSSLPGALNGAFIILFGLQRVAESNDGSLAGEDAGTSLLRFFSPFNLFSGLALWILARCCTANLMQASSWRAGARKRCVPDHSGHPADAVSLHGVSISC